MLPRTQSRGESLLWARWHVESAGSKHGLCSSWKQHSHHHWDISWLAAFAAWHLHGWVSWPQRPPVLAYLTIIHVSIPCNSAGQFSWKIITIHLCNLHSTDQQLCVLSSTKCRSIIWIRMVPPHTHLFNKCLWEKSELWFISECAGESTGWKSCTEPVFERAGYKYNKW